MSRALSEEMANKSVVSHGHYFISICGASGSGKSKLINQLINGKGSNFLETSNSFEPVHTKSVTILTTTIKTGFIMEHHADGTTTTFHCHGIVHMKDMVRAMVAQTGNNVLRISVFLPLQYWTSRFAKYMLKLHPDGFALTEQTDSTTSMCMPADKYILLNNPTMLLVPDHYMQEKKFEKKESPCFTHNILLCFDDKRTIHPVEEDLKKYLIDRTKFHLSNVFWLSLGNKESCHDFCLLFKD